MQEHLIREHHIDISGFSEAFLTKTFAERMEAMNCQMPDCYLEKLQKNESERLLLQESLTVTYTEFFRSPLSYAILEQVVFPNIMALKGMTGQSEIRVWAAGCSSGQEPYSIGIVLADLLFNRQGSFSWRIFGTDISGKELDIAVKGEYPEPLTGNIKAKHLNRYFTRKENVYSINDEIREHVTFSFHDLLDNGSIAPSQSIFGDFDVILCCNVLLYFNCDTQKLIIDKFFKAVNDRGYLVLGDEETSLLRLSNRFAPVFSPSSVYYKR
ncbi:MAG TPA: protein-glutamate O-methyltransferase CheR [Bacteroidales bacterium]|nr:protein-glutamate O-methyltransferase CheR [Bacteroidales bacterium]